MYCSEGINPLVWLATPKSKWKKFENVDYCQFQDCHKKFSYWSFGLNKYNCHRCGIVLCASCITPRSMTGLYTNEVYVCFRCAKLIDLIEARHRQQSLENHIKLMERQKPSKTKNTSSRFDGVASLNFSPEQSTRDSPEPRRGDEEERNVGCSPEKQASNPTLERSPTALRVSSSGNESLVDRLQRLLLEEKEHESLRRQAYQQDVENLVKEKNELLRQITALNKKFSSSFVGLEDGTDDSAKAIPEQNSAATNQATKEAAKESRLLKKSVQGLEFLLRRERAKVKELEERLMAKEQNKETASFQPPSSEEQHSDPSAAPDSWGQIQTPRIPLTGPVERGASGSRKEEYSRSELASWAEDLYEKEEVLNHLFDCIQARETQLQIFFAEAKRRSRELIDIQLSLLREERILILGEELDTNEQINFENLMAGNVVDVID